MDILYHSSIEFYRILSTGIPAHSQILLKQLIHLRTVIVTADIDEGLYNSALRTENPNNKIQMTKI